MRRIAVFALFYFIGLQHSAATEIIRMATMSPPGSPSRFVYDHLLHYVEEQTNGDYTIEPYFSGELGAEESYFSAMRRGRIQLSAVSGQGIGTAVPEFAVLRAPYLFDSFEELAFVYDHYASDLINTLFSQKGMVHLEWAANGWENIYAKKAVLSPNDVIGYRIRVPLEPSSALFFDSAGADVIQIPFTDIIQSLQTGLIDGGESTTLMYVQAGLFSEAPHLTETRHGFSLAVYAANKAWFETLPLSAQGIFRDAYMRPTNAYPILRQTTQRMLDDLSDEEVRVHSLTRAQRRTWMLSSAQAAEKLIDQTGGRSAELYERILLGKSDFAAQHREQLKQQ